MQIIKNGLVYFDKHFHNVDIVFKNNKIIKIEKDIDINQYKNAQIIDVKEKIITPNFTDVHVHFRYPGQTHKEDITTGVASAINGGYTTVVMMANTKPVIDNQEVLNLVEAESKKHPINLKSYLTMTLGQKGQKNNHYFQFINNDFVVAFSDDGYGIQSSEIMENGIMESAKYNFLIATHLQDDKYCKSDYVMHKGKTSVKLGLDGCSSKVEFKQAQRDLKLVKKYPKARYHISHISTKETLEVVKEAKAIGLNFSCEVAPHHLLLNENDIPGNDGMWKMNPPLRSKEDSQALIKALNSGIIEIIATDHAPHTKVEKQNGFKSPFGIIGLDHCFATLYTYLVKTNKVKIETIIEAMSNAPNKIYNLGDASIKEGNNANFNIIDLKRNFILDENFIKSKSKNTPFLNQKLFGKITHVFYKGKNLME